MIHNKTFFSSNAEWNIAFLTLMSGYDLGPRFVSHFVHAAVVTHLLPLPFGAHYNV